MNKYMNALKRSKLTAILCSAAGILFLTAIFALGLRIGRNTADQYYPRPTSTDRFPEDTTTGYAENSYILGQWNGKLALFVPPSDEPKQVYDIYISIFPETEQHRLEQGVEIRGDAELAALLEDYTS